MGSTNALAEGSGHHAAHTSNDDEEGADSDSQGRWGGLGVLLVATIACGSVWADSAPSAAPAPTADLAIRVANLEAYVTKGTPKVLSSAGPGHNAWMMVSSALVLFMTLPGLALFYGGLVRRKNVLSVMAPCLGCAGIVTILWWGIGYSLSFARGTPYLGSANFALLAGVGATPNADYGAWVSHSVFAMYQLMFAIITPALS
jgi:ammonium transporter, Amt family